MACQSFMVKVDLGPALDALMKRHSTGRHMSDLYQAPIWIYELCNGRQRRCTISSRPPPGAIATPNLQTTYRPARTPDVLRRSLILQIVSSLQKRQEFSGEGAEPGFTMVPCKIPADDGADSTKPRLNMMFPCGSNDNCDLKLVSSGGSQERFE